MLPNSRQPLVDPGSRDYRTFWSTQDGQGVKMVEDAHFPYRGQEFVQEAATFAASSASGATQTVSLAMPTNRDIPRSVTLIVINHADEPISFTVAQTVNDFVAGSGTATPTIFTSVANVAAGASASAIIQSPFTTDGPCVVAFTLTAASTNGGKVGAQFRWN